MSQQSHLLAGSTHEEMPCRRFRSLAHRASVHSPVLALLLFLGATAQAAEYFAISVVDDATGRGVPLVELRTVDGSRYWTDSQGLVAYHEPGLMNQKVFFHVTSDGYEFPADGFGFRGKALITTPGESAELRIPRRNLAQRLYRVTGAGIYRDSVLLVREVPIEQPVLNAQVAGSDSVNSIVFRGAVHWFWGDTNRPAYPLGTFHVPGAVSQLPGQGGLDPLRGVNLKYFTRDDGFAASTAEMPGDGPTWIDGVCTVKSTDGRERMFAKYVKVRKFLEVYERGLVEFDPEKQRFEKVATFDFDAPLYPLGHALPRVVDGTDYIYFGNPYPLVRVRATAEALRDPGRYEAFTCLKAGSTLAKPEIERDAAGHIQYGWKRNTPAPTGAEQAKWLSVKKLKPGEELLALRDVESGKPVVAHAGSVAYNAFRKRYVMIAEEYGGTSLLGEVWYAEADTPLGPWVYARKIVTHDKYSFYNPRQHPMFDQEEGRRIFFEGTYSTFFTGIEQPTPRYDYNQIMYALELDDPRLTLPVAVYETNTDGQVLSASPKEGDRIAFMGPDRPGAGLVAVGTSAERKYELHLGNTDEKSFVAVFYALPPDVKDPPATTVPLFKWRDPTDGMQWHGIEGRPGPPGYQRDGKPLCRVWRYPLTFEIPRS